MPTLNESLSPVADSEPTYGSINLKNTDDGSDLLDELSDDADAITDDNGDNLKC